MKTHITQHPNRGSKLLTAVMLVVGVAVFGGAAAFWMDRPKLIEHVAQRDRLATPAAIVLRLQGPPEEARAPLLAAMEQGEPSLRAAAARALGEYKKRDLVTDLGKAALADEDPGVRAAAFEGLDVTGDSSASSFVREGLNDPDPGVRVAACGAVAGIQMYEGIPWLIELLASNDQTVRDGALRALERFLPAGQEGFGIDRAAWGSSYESMRR